MSNAARVFQRVAPRPSAPEPLFRPEVLAERQTQWLGTVLLAPRISHTAFACAALVAAAAVLAFLVLGSYTRKAHVGGWLISQQGLARISTPHPGVVTEISVGEGATVTKGARLITISAETQTDARGGTKDEVIRKLQDRRESLANAKRVLETQMDQESSDLGRRVELQRARTALSSNALARDQVMRARDLISLPRLQRTEQEHLDNQASLVTLESSIRDLPFRRQTRLAELDRGIAAIDQETAEAEARRQIVITAPHAGTVTAIQAEAGSTAQPNVPLMTIIPVNSVLQAQLFAPSRAMGFLHPGQRVMLRYQAFPYQKFGSYAGSISAISSSAISPSELPQQLKGLSGVYGGNEPLYRITVNLERQTAVAYGEAATLQPGMQLEADVMIESRRLIEWVFEPLFTMTGKWRS